MLDWCCLHVPADAWAEHGHSERTRKGEASQFVARLYFANEADAETFPASCGLGHDPVTPQIQGEAGPAPLSDAEFA